ncbi:partial Hydroxypyruvate reductase, partial [Anaerolineae bacterium]
KVIVRPGVGYDLIDVAACRANDIQVCYLPDYCVDEVADHAVALLMAVERKLWQHQRNCQAGVWNDQQPGPIRRLNTLTLGLIGLGKIGRRFVAKMREIIPTVIAYDPYLPDAMFAQANAKKVSLDELYQNADVIAIFAPLTTENRRIISADSIKKMVRHPIIVNVSRGGQVDTVDLIAGLKSGAISGAGLDVLDTEPKINPELTQLDNVVLTPHAGWFSVESETENRTRTAQEIIRVIRGEPPRNPVP